MPRIYESHRTEILAAAVKLAREKGLEGFTRINVAKASGVAESTVSHHFPTMDVMRAAVAKHAAENGLVSILADTGAVNRTGVSLDMKLRKRVAEYIAR